MQKHGSQLRQERERRGWSRSYVAEQVSVDTMTVGRWERSERVPHPHHRQKLCALFEKNAQELGFFSEDSYVIDDMTTKDADSRMIFEQIAAVDAPPELEKLVEVAVTTTNPQRISPMYKKHEASQETSFSKRRALIGLGGFGIVALACGSALWYLHAIPAHTAGKSSLTAITQIKRHAYQFLDPNVNNWVNRVSWSPNSRKLAAANGKNVVSIWSLDAGGMLVDYYPTLHQWVNDVSWSKDNWLAAVTADFQSGSLHVWNTIANQPAFVLERSYGLRSVSWSPDGKHLAFAGHAAKVEVWDPFAHRLIYEYLYPQLGMLGINRVRWSTNGTFLACAVDDGTIHIWEAFTGVRTMIYHKHTGRVHDLAWSPDMRYIASAGADKKVQVWEVATGNTLITYREHTNEVEGIDWSPLGKYIASGSKDLAVHIWDALEGKLSAIAHLKSSPEGLMWSPNGKTVAVATDTEGIVVLQPAV